MQFKLPQFLSGIRVTAEITTPHPANLSSQPTYIDACVDDKSLELSDVVEDLRFLEFEVRERSAELNAYLQHVEQLERRCLCIDRNIDILSKNEELLLGVMPSD